MSLSSIGKEQDNNNQLPPGVKSFAIGVAKATGGTVLAIGMLTSSIVAGGMVGLAISFRNLPDVRLLRNYVPSETSYIYDVKGKLLSRLHGEENREVVRLKKISPELKRAVIAIEDSHFYQHNGINVYSIGRAIVANWKHGEVVEGASTLTMQLVKNLFLSRDRVFTRKLVEAVLAIRVEQVFNKDEVLEMYLNNIYWGHNNYGVQTAAQSYFNKSAAELNLAEAAMMAGLIQAPETYSPFNNYPETKKRQALVLQRMRELGWITPTEETAALSEPLLVGKPTAWAHSHAPYVTEAVVHELNQRFGNQAVIRGGMRVQTTVDFNLQLKAQEIVQKAHERLHRSIRADQIALVAVDPRTHFVKVIVGGVDYKNSQFNRAIQAQRQPGSAFKPFVYYAAFASGKYSPDSIINDSPASFRIPAGYYSPKNYDGGFMGPMSITRALMLSRNVPAVSIGRSVGLSKVIETCQTLGIKSPLTPVVSLPLGASGITPLEMAGAYATFASNGWSSDTTLIVRVTDSEGNLILDNTPQPQLILNQWATASLTSVLKQVIEAGTGRAADIGRPAAGKTGTTSDVRDIWFVGYVPQLATAVWLGNDNYKPLAKGSTGGVFAAPLWREFMLEALKNEPVKQFPAASKFTRPKIQDDLNQRRMSKRFRNF